MSRLQGSRIYSTRSPDDAHTMWTRSLFGRHRVATVPSSTDGSKPSTQSPKLIIIRPHSASSVSPINVYVDGLPIPQVDDILAMIRQVSNRSSGLREEDQQEDQLSLVEACVISRIAYNLPFQRLTQAKEVRIDAMIRKAMELARGLTNYFHTPCP
ncbi:hypothetical protein HPB50_013846 [Hyalomma asiaticum]|uniref:Uncharacterized protein n=1 Tax=Hyalomma asiaticum TaxID=266040 RepID=A0ACB7RUL2_HYAAI|nr:hypothetical protein HPB50_013846 [Hyalomma asiaticum]